MSRRRKKAPRKPTPRKKIQGKVSASKFEVDIYNKLVRQNKNKHKITYEKDKINYVLNKYYVPDFTIETKDGIIYIEAKGRGRGFDGPARSKMVAIKEQHPELDIRFVFMDDGIVRKGSKMTCSSWAKKYGYTYSIGSIPQEWLE